MLADAQTSGGLLISCPNDRAEEFLQVLSWDMNAFRIGEISEKQEKLITYCTKNQLLTCVSIKVANDKSFTVEIHL